MLDGVQYVLYRLYLTFLGYRVVSDPVFRDVCLVLFGRVESLYEWPVSGAFTPRRVIEEVVCMLSGER